MNLKRTFVLAAAALMTAAGVANAFTYTVVAGSGSGNWDSASTWTSSDGGTTYPGASDTANINNSSYTVNVVADGAAATLNLSNGTLVINSPRTLAIGTANITGGTLTINAGGIMTTASASSISSSAAVTVSGSIVVSSGLDINGTFILNGGTLDIDGGAVDVKANSTLQLQGTSPSPLIQIDVADGLRLSTATSKLLVMKDATIQASNNGSIRGDNSSAQVDIDVTGGNVTLTLASGATMHGGMVIQKAGTDNGTANFVNAGIVKADSSRTIRFGDLLDSITDSYGAGNRCDVHWRAESGPSILSFEIPATSLVTSFFVDGTFNCNGNTVTTTGNKSGANPPACVGVGSPC